MLQHMRMLWAIGGEFDEDTGDRIRLEFLGEVACEIFPIAAACIAVSCLEIERRRHRLWQIYDFTNTLLFIIMVYGMVRTEQRYCVYPWLLTVASRMYKELNHWREIRARPWESLVMTLLLLTIGTSIVLILMAVVFYCMAQASLYYHSE